MSQTKTALVTAFDAFGGDDINSSAETLKYLPASLKKLQLSTLLLPTSFSRAWITLEQRLDETMPDIVVLLGQAESRSRVSLERLAINFQAARIPDNDGAMPQGIAVLEGAPDSYETALPLEFILARLNQEKIPAEISNDAGRFVCNTTFFKMMHRRATARHKTAAGFVHLPRLPLQAANKDEADLLDATVVARAITLLLEITAGT